MPTTPTLEEELKAHTDAISDAFRDGAFLSTISMREYLHARDAIHHKHHARLVEALTHVVGGFYGNGFVDEKVIEEAEELLSQYPDSNQRKEV